MAKILEFSSLMSSLGLRFLSLSGLTGQSHHGDPPRGLGDDIVGYFRIPKLKSRIPTLNSRIPKTKF